MITNAVNNLTPHFTLEELTHSATALRLGIDNTPAAEIVENLRVLAGGLETAREILGGLSIRVNSGYRCEALERILAAKDFEAWCARRGLRRDEAAWRYYMDGDAVQSVGGWAGKAHPWGWAADWTCPAFGTPLLVVRHLAKSSMSFDKLIQEGTWVHSSWHPWRRREVLTAQFVGGTPSYKVGA